MPCSVVAGQNKTTKLRLDKIQLVSYTAQYARPYYVLCWKVQHINKRRSKDRQKKKISIVPCFVLFFQRRRKKKKSSFEFGSHSNRQRVHNGPWAPIKRHTKKANCLVFFLLCLHLFDPFRALVPVVRFVHFHESSGKKRKMKRAQRR